MIKILNTKSKKFSYQLNFYLNLRRENSSSKLNIVKPKQNWPNSKAKATSVGAYDIIKKAKIFNNTQDAINEFDVVFSLSARKRDINKKHISISQFLKIISTRTNTKFGMMFGPEASGLSNEDLSYSNYILQIPTNKKFKSLNLAHSLTIMCYEIFKAVNNIKFTRKGKKLEISAKKNISSIIDHLINLLDERSFFTPKEPAKTRLKMAQALRRESQTKRILF